eukprot:COSAG05_NODE_1863_length_3942_cov_2.381473_6_plen_230_part_00
MTVDSMHTYGIDNGQGWAVIELSHEVRVASSGAQALGHGSVGARGSLDATSARYDYGRMDVVHSWREEGATAAAFGGIQSSADRAAIVGGAVAHATEHLHREEAAALYRVGPCGIRTLVALELTAALGPSRPGRGLDKAAGRVEPPGRRATAAVQVNVALCAARRDQPLLLRSLTLPTLGLDLAHRPASLQRCSAGWRQAGPPIPAQQPPPLLLPGNSKGCWLTASLLR